MSPAYEYQLAAVDRSLALRAREDVEATSVSFSGQQAYVLKDPLTLEMFHLTAEEHFLFQALRETVSLSRLRRLFEARFAPRHVSHEALQQGINNLYNQGLLLGDAPAQGQELLERGDRRRRSERLQGLLQLLSIRVASFDATPVVDGLYGKVRWLFSLPVRLLAFSAMLYAGCILLGHGREVVARLPSLAELAQPQYWLLWVATIVSVKVVHELAHATTCHHYGGRCHEIGVLLLAFIPCLYCDVSDVWRVPSKWRRIAISAAGMIAELVIASVALIAWWHTAPGLLHTWCLSLVIVCSVGTLLVNLNPLLRYDGYYILSDLAEVPNLAGRSQGLLPAALKRWLLRQPRTHDPLLSPRQRHGLLLYALATRVYLTLVLLGIFVMLLAWATPRRLENLIMTLGAVVLLGMLIRPLPALWRILKNPSLRTRLSGLRTFLLGVGFAAIGAALFTWPLSDTISGPVVLVPAEGHTVYATTAGQLTFAVAPGTRVSEGDVIAQLAEPDIEMAIAQQRGELELRRARYEQLNKLRALETQASRLLPTTKAAVADAESQLRQLEQQQRQLEVSAPAAGVVVSPPEAAGDSDDPGRLPSWSGSPLEARNLGSWVEPGTVFCTIADPSRLDALLKIDQADIPYVEPGQEVRILLDADPTCVVYGEIVRVGRRAVRPGATSFQAADAPAPYHLVQVCLKEPTLPLLVGLRGRAKIEANNTTLGQTITSEISQMLRIPW